MNGLFSGWPYPAALIALTMIAFLRGGLTYLVGRAIGSGATRTRIRKVIDSRGFQRASEALNHWGPPVVSLCFLTFGFQTLVNLAAGVTRMPPKRYVPALAIGAMLWGFLYATVGFVTFAAWYHVYQRWPIVAVVILILVAGGIVTFVATQVFGLRRGSTEGDSIGRTRSDPADGSVSPAPESALKRAEERPTAGTEPDH